MKKIELLSPAKNPEIGIQAINHGADAVYIGAEEFGARKAAGNKFSDIEKLINYAHKYSARVFITLNTIFYDNESEKIKDYILKAYNSGADAIIIQDLGILMMDLPPIQIHASTQTHNHDIEKIKFIEKAGFDRVILARETSVGDVAAIRKNTSIELEYFIHGALCVSYSGQCYISQTESGRSANRGDCSQLCRVPYNLTNKNGKLLVKNKHLLSLKDLNLSEHLTELLDAGISSFKIEGRLKDIDYVKNITAYYRQRLDNVLEENPDFRKSSVGKVMVYFEPDPDKTFNRGYSEYFFSGERKKIGNQLTPKSVGEYLGKIKFVEKDSFVIDTKIQLQCGDGLCFFDAKGELTGMNINKIENKRVFFDEMRGINPGTPVYRNYNHSFQKTLSKKSAERLISINMNLKETDSGFILECIDETGISASAEVTAEKITARSSDQKDILIRQLSKTGNSIFYLQGPPLVPDKSYFIPVNVINELRRNVLLILEQKRSAFYERQLRSSKTDFDALKEIFKIKELDYSYNSSNSYSDEFFLKIGAVSIEPALELQKDYRNKLLMTTKFCIKYELDKCPVHQISDGEYNSELYLESNFKKYKLEFDCKKCLMKLYNL